jgi:hypothetical protein
MTIPPKGAECCARLCRTVAVVRLVVRHDADPADYCDLDWRNVRATILARGHSLVDNTGDVGELQAEYQNWHIWQCRTGLFYATAVFNGQGTTVYAYLVGKLRAEIAAVEAGHASKVSA